MGSTDRKYWRYEKSHRLNVDRTIWTYREIFHLNPYVHDLYIRILIIIIMIIFKVLVILYTLLHTWNDLNIAIKAQTNKTTSRLSLQYDLLNQTPNTYHITHNNPCNTIFSPSSFKTISQSYSCLPLLGSPSLSSFTLSPYNMCIISYAAHCVCRGLLPASSVPPLLPPN
jgi:hypothetical protein